MSEGILSHRYAVAFLSFVQPDRREHIEGELRLIAEFIHHNVEFQQIMNSPRVSLRNKDEFFEKILNQIEPAPEINTFLRVLLKKGRLNIVSDIYAQVHFLLQQQKNCGHAVVKTAVPMNADMQGRIKSRLEQWIHKSLEVIFTIDTSLIGGIVVMMGDLVYDGSVRLRLRKLYDALRGV